MGAKGRSRKRRLAKVRLMPFRWADLIVLAVVIGIVGAVIVGALVLGTAAMLGYLLYG